MTGIIKTVTISKNTSDKYYVSILVDDGLELPKQLTERSSRAPGATPGVATSEKAIGIDVGITDIAVTSDGDKFSNPKWMSKGEKNRVRKERKLARSQKGSNRRNKARLLVSKIHNHIANCRSDFLHKLSRRIVDENQIICVENLNVKAMTKNRKLSRAICSIGWGMLCTMLKYKAEWSGKTYLEVDRFFPSSKTCSHCYHKQKELPLNIRSWQCPECETIHDRDINAAVNIREEGLRILSVGSISFCSWKKSKTRSARQEKVSR